MIFLRVRSLRLYFYAMPATTGWIRQHSMPNLTIALTKPRLKLIMREPNPRLVVITAHTEFQVWFFWLDKEKDPYVTSTVASSKKSKEGRIWRGGSGVVFWWGLPNGPSISSQWKAHSTQWTDHFFWNGTRFPMVAPFAGCNGSSIAKKNQALNGWKVGQRTQLFYIGWKETATTNTEILWSEIKSEDRS